MSQTPAFKGRRRGPRIGLLGGSFNPAHAGHRAISLEALTRLQLDQVWWLISPQNPLKAEAGMAGFHQRFARACQVANHSRIKVSDFEARQHLQYTADSLKAIKRRFPNHRFVWLMGADNLVQFHKWRAWQDIAGQMPLAVFDRPGSTYPALASRASRALRPYRSFRPQHLVDRPAPAWCFLFRRRYDISATSLRQAGLF